MLCDRKQINGFHFHASHKQTKRDNELAGGITIYTKIMVVSSYH